MMYDKLRTSLRWVFLLPLFVIIVTLYMPFKIIKDLWVATASEVNNWFN